MEGNMYQKIIKLLIVVLICTFSVMCQKGNNEPDKQKKTEVVQVKKEVASVCIWDKASVRAEPNKNGKWISAMALGEKVARRVEPVIKCFDVRRSKWEAEKP